MAKSASKATSKVRGLFTDNQWQFLLFLLSGSIGTVLFYGVYEGLHYVLQTLVGTLGASMLVSLAWAISYLLSIVWQHALHRLLVFGSRGNYVKSLVATYIAYSLSLVLSSLLSYLLSAVGMPYQLVWLLSLGATGVFNFFAVRDAFK